MKAATVLEGGYDVRCEFWIPSIEIQHRSLYSDSCVLNSEVSSFPFLLFTFYLSFK